jgi:hypothetical protein
MFAMRIRALVLAGLLLATLSALPGCDVMPTPPTPVISGPDTGWARYPVAFTVAFAQKSGSWTTVVRFDWGDGGSLEQCPLGDSYSHIYMEPGIYAARCYLSNSQRDLMDNNHYRDGNWSSPRTVQILREPGTVTPFREASGHRAAGPARDTSPISNPKRVKRRNQGQALFREASGHHAPLARGSSSQFAGCSS